MNAIKPAIAVAVLGLLIVFFVLRSPPEALPEKEDKPGSSTLGHQRPNDNSASRPARRIRSILNEPNADFRRPLLRGYFHTLDAEEFPEAFDSLVRTLGRQRSREYNYLMRVWAEKDPQAAWQFIRPLFDAAAPTRWSDSWDPENSNNDELIPPNNLQQLHTLQFWPDKQLFDSFAGGLRFADLPETERAQLAGAYEAKIRSHFDADYEFSALALPVDNDDRAREYLLSTKVGQAAPHELPELIEKARIGNLPTAFGIALRRLVQLDPDQIDTALKLAASYASSEDPREIPRQTQVVIRTSTEIARAWAEQDPRAAWAWFAQNHHDELVGFAGKGMIPFLTKAQRQGLLQRANQDIELYKELIQAWATEDLSAALTTASGFLDDEQFTDLLFRLEDYNLDPDGWTPFLETLEGIPAQLENATMAQIMEGIGDWDAAAAARFGVDWLLTSNLERDQILRVWRGESDPGDGLMDDRTFGCLRCWALTEPLEMQAWINSRQDPSVRAALQFIHDHAAGK